MSLNIKDPEVYCLARALARETGDTMTGAVKQALRERFQRIGRRRGKATAAELRAISLRAAAGVRRPYVDHGELLYDEYGLPK